MAKDYPTNTLASEGHKVWNDKMGYMMDEDLNKKLDKKVLGYQGDSELAEDVKEEDQEESKMQVFDSAVMDAVCAAKDMYIDEGESLDHVIDELIKWLEDCKGHEEEYMKEVEDFDGEEYDGEEESDRDKEE